MHTVVYKTCLPREPEGHNFMSTPSLHIGLPSPNSVVPSITRRSTTLLIQPFAVQPNARSLSTRGTRRVGIREWIARCTGTKRADRPDRRSPSVSKIINALLEQGASQRRPGRSLNNGASSTRQRRAGVASTASHRASYRGCSRVSRRGTKLCVGSRCGRRRCKTQQLALGWCEGDI